MDMRDWIRRNRPEDDCIDHGDVYLAHIVELDECIWESIADWCADTDARAAARAIAAATQAQLAYEMSLLARWWRLDEPRPP
jgi:hypothetical protein